jgi:flavin-dependent dehydrogenase
LHEDIIRDELAKHGCRVELGKTLRSFTQDSAGVTAEVVVHSAVKEQDERIETIRALYLAGADGPAGEHIPPTVSR